MSKELTKNEQSGFFDDIKEMFAATDKKFIETDKRFLETDKKFKQAEQMLRDYKVENEKILSRLDKQIGELGNRLGEFVEEMVRPAVVGLFQEKGLDVHQVTREYQVFDEVDAVEIDLLVIDGTDAVAVECKSKVDIDDVDDHIERLKVFKRLSPQHRSFNLMGAVAGMVVPQHVSRYAYKKGLFILAQRGEFVEILNDEKFEPKYW